MTRLSGFLIVSGIALLLHGKSLAQTNAVPDTVVMSKSKKGLAGKWEIDSLVFINNGVRGNASPPLMPTFWEINENRTIAIKGPMSMNVEYILLADGSFVINIGGTDLIYEIRKLSDKSMILENVIMATENFDMRSLTYFSRK